VTQTGKTCIKSIMSENDAEPHQIETLRPLTPEATRALAEAEERRKAAAKTAGTAATEVGGRNGPDPVRFGDWERGGIASDF
jgi:hypothetical protein